MAKFKTSNFSYFSSYRDLFYSWYCIGIQRRMTDGFLDLTKDSGSHCPPADNAGSSTKKNRSCGKIEMSNMSLFMKNKKALNFNILNIRNVTINSYKNRRLRRVFSLLVPNTLLMHWKLISTTLFMQVLLFHYLV